MSAYLTPQQVARVWACSGETVRRLCASGELRAVRVGALWRIPAEALEEYRQRHTVAAAPPVQASPPAPMPVALGPLPDLPADYEPVFPELWPTHVARPATRRGGSARTKRAASVRT
jgi:excisionase family DNA binding protein